MKADIDDNLEPIDDDQKIRRLKDELDDIITLNADIKAGNQRKDQLIESREGQLRKLRDIFQSDTDQLELVRPHVFIRSICNILGAAPNTLSYVSYSTKLNDIFRIIST